MCRTYSAAAKPKGPQMSDKTVTPFACESFMYACKVKETADGCWRGARSQARQALQVIVERRFARDVQIHEQGGAAQNGQDQAQRETDAETQEEIALPLSFGSSEGWGRLPNDESFILRQGHYLFWGESEILRDQCIWRSGQ